VAEWIARNHGYEILSADSMLVYRGMDIGTAKPTLAQRHGIAYHGLDLVNPDEHFSVGQWLETATQVLNNAAANNRRVIITGGTGLFIKALFHGIQAPPADPALRTHYETFFKEHGLASLQEEARRTAPAAFAALNADDVRNPRRIIRLLEKHTSSLSTLEVGCSMLDVPVASREHRTSNVQHPTSDPLLSPSLYPLPPPVFLLDIPPATLGERIAARTRAMLAAGWGEEVRALHQRYPQWDSTACKAIGYAEIAAMLRGELSPAQAEERITIRTRQYARRQRTFFRHQFPVIPIPAPDSPADIPRCAALLLQN